MKIPFRQAKKRRKILLENQRLNTAKFIYVYKPVVHLEKT